MLQIPINHLSLDWQVGFLTWTLNPVLESGFHSVDAARAGDARTEGIYGEDIKGGVLYPKVWQLSFSLRVAHEHKLGWKTEDGLVDRKSFLMERIRDLQKRTMTMVRQC